jgi:hypothetical protein
MDYLRGPLYLDVAAKVLCLAGVLLMIFGPGGWFTVGVFAVAVGVLFGAWSLVSARRMAPSSGFSSAAPFRARPPENDVGEGDGSEGKP